MPAIPDMSSILLTIGGAIVGNAVVLAVLGFLGKGVFNAIVSRDLEKFKAELKSEGDKEIEAIRRTASREIESYKVKLKKSEFLFERQFQAANAMVKLYSEFSPQRRHPNMEWSDAVEEIVSAAATTENKLREFRNEHGAALHPSDRELLESAVRKANDIDMGDYNGDGDEIASGLLAAIRDLKESLIAKVQDQSSL